MQNKSNIRRPLSKPNLESGIKKRMEHKSNIHILVSKFNLESGIAKSMHNKSNVHIPCCKHIILTIIIILSICVLNNSDRLYFAVDLAIESLIAAMLT